MDLVERFRYLMKLNQLTASAFADEIGVQRSSVSHILSGRNKPSLEFIQKVIQRFPKVDAAWLISGVSGAQTENEPIVAPQTKQEEAPIQLKEDSISPQVAFAADVKDDPQAHKTSEKLRKVKRIVVFYTDETFEEFTSLNR